MSTTSTNDTTSGSDSDDSCDNCHLSQSNRKKKNIIVDGNACCKLFLELR